MSEDVAELRRQCLLGARFLWRELRELYGHVSCRLPSGDGFLLMMTRVPVAPLDPDEVLVFDYDGKKLEGEQPTPYEIYLHTEIYRRRPDVQSIVHSHPHVATAVSTTGNTIYALTHQSKRYGTGIPVFKGDFIDDQQLGVELADCLGAAPAMLLKAHGAVTVGRHVPESVGNMLFLEQAAQQQVWAAAVGTPEPLPQRLRDYKFAGPTEVGGGDLNLWRQLVWDLETGQGGRHPGD